jgi:hypothetical protein
MASVSIAKVGATAVGAAAPGLLGFGAFLRGVASDTGKSGKKAKPSWSLIGSLVKQCSFIGHHYCAYHLRKKTASERRVLQGLDQTIDLLQRVVVGD